MGRFKYYAFISYSHKDSDWAKWVQHELEYYHLPASLSGRRGLPDTFRPVYRDEDELAGGVLMPQISAALADSDYLIVICSPSSSRSRYVNNEIIEFIEIGKKRGEDYRRKIFPFIVEGKPHQKSGDPQCFPPVLEEMCNDADDPVELIAGDVNATSRDHAFVKVLAGTLQDKDIRFSDLWDRYEKFKLEEETRKREERDRLFRANARFISERATELTEKGNSYLARKVLVELYGNEGTDYPYVPEAERALRKAMEEDSMTLEYGLAVVTSSAISRRGDKIVVSTLRGQVFIYDSFNGKLLGVIDGIRTDIGSIIDFSKDDSLMVLSGGDKVYVCDLKEYKKECEWQWPDKSFYHRLVGARFSDETGRFIVVVSDLGRVFLLEADTFAVVRELAYDVSEISIDMGWRVDEDRDTGALKKWRCFDSCRPGEFVVHDGTVIASFNDGRIRTIRLADGEARVLKAVKGKFAPLISLSTENDLVVAAGNSVKIYNLKTLRLKQRIDLDLIGARDEYISMACLSGRVLAVSVDTGRTRESSLVFLYKHDKSFVPLPRMRKYSPTVIFQLSMDENASKILYNTEDGIVKLYGAGGVKPDELAECSEWISELVPLQGNAVGVKVGNWDSVILDYGSCVAEDVNKESWEDPSAKLWVWESDAGRIGTLLSPLTVFWDKGRFRVTADNFEQTMTLRSGDDDIQSVPYPDLGSFDFLLLTPDRSRLLSFKQNSVQFWEIPSLRPLESFRVEDAIFGEKGTIITSRGDIVTRGNQGTTLVLDGEDLSVKRVIKCPDPFTDCRICSLSPDEKYLLTATQEHRLYVWEFATGVLMKTFILDTITAACFSSDGTLILVGTEEGLLLGIPWSSFDELVQDQKALFSGIGLSAAERAMFYLESGKDESTLPGE